MSITASIHIKKRLTLAVRALQLACRIHLCSVAVAFALIERMIDTRFFGPQIRMRDTEPWHDLARRRHGTQGHQGDARQAA